MQKRHGPINSSHRSFQILGLALPGKTTVTFALHKVSTECSNILFLGDRNVKVVKTGNGIQTNKVGKKGGSPLTQTAPAQGVTAADLT